MLHWKLCSARYTVFWTTHSKLHHTLDIVCRTARCMLHCTLYTALHTSCFIARCMLNCTPPTARQASQSRHQRCAVNMCYKECFTIHTRGDNEKWCGKSLPLAGVLRMTVWGSVHLHIGIVDVWQVHGVAPLVADPSPTHWGGALYYLDGVGLVDNWPSTD